MTKRGVGSAASYPLSWGPALPEALFGQKGPCPLGGSFLWVRLTRVILSQTRPKSAAEVSPVWYKKEDNVTLNL